VPPAIGDTYGIYLRKRVPVRIVGHPGLVAIRVLWKVSIHSLDDLAGRIQEAGSYKSLSDITKM
jgi:hypothetical protein